MIAICIRLLQLIMQLKFDSIAKTAASNIAMRSTIAIVDLIVLNSIMSINKKVSVIMSKWLGPTSYS